MECLRKMFQKVGKEMRHKFETKEENGVFIITITKTGETEKSAEKEENIVVLIRSKMGEEEDELEKYLLGFIIMLLLKLKPS